MLRVQEMRKECFLQSVAHKEEPKNNTQKEVSIRFISGKKFHASFFLISFEFKIFIFSCKYKWSRHGQQVNTQVLPALTWRLPTAGLVLAKGQRLRANGLFHLNASKANFNSRSRFLYPSGCNCG